MRLFAMRLLLLPLILGLVLPASSLAQASPPSSRGGATRDTVSRRCLAPGYHAVGMPVLWLHGPESARLEEAPSATRAAQLLTGRWEVVQVMTEGSSAVPRVTRWVVTIHEVDTLGRTKAEVSARDPRGPKGLESTYRADRGELVWQDRVGGNVFSVTRVDTRMAPLGQLSGRWRFGPSGYAPLERGGIPVGESPSGYFCAFRTTTRE